MYVKTELTTYCKLFPTTIASNFVINKDRYDNKLQKLAILVFTYAKKDGTLKKFIREVHVKIRYSDGMKYLGVWPLVGVVPLSHGHYREMWWTPKQKGSVRKGRKERSFGHFHIMSFHFCVCLFKALFSDSRINKYVRIVQYTIVQYNTLQYIKLRYSIEAPNKYLYCTVLFRTVLYKNEKICPRQRIRNTQTFQKLKSTLSSLDPFRIHEGVGQ